MIVFSMGLTDFFFLFFNGVYIFGIIIFFDIIIILNDTHLFYIHKVDIFCIKVSKTPDYSNKFLYLISFFEIHKNTVKKY